ncbi:alpha-N-arabinofuranosidase, partial [Lysobacter sp. 2RAB21]
MRKNNWWGGAAETNAFGTHEFMDFVEQIGAEAYISINVGSSTPTYMREWIEYMTSPGQDTLAQERRKNGRDKPWKVALWGIGNESWGCGGNMKPEYYANELRRFGSFFHQGEDNPGLRVATGPNSDDTRWTEVLMKDAAQAMDALSLHYYT